MHFHKTIYTNTRARALQHVTKKKKLKKLFYILGTGSLKVHKETKNREYPKYATKSNKRYKSLRLIMSLQKVLIKIAKKKKG